MTEDQKQSLQAILDLAEARLRNPQDLTPNTEHDLREIARIAKATIPTPVERRADDCEAKAGVFYFCPDPDCPVHGERRS